MESMLFFTCTRKRYDSGFRPTVTSLLIKELTLHFSPQVPIAVQFAWAAILSGGMVRVFFLLASRALDDLQFSIK